MNGYLVVERIDMSGEKQVGEWFMRDNKDVEELRSCLREAEDRLDGLGLHVPDRWRKALGDEPERRTRKSDKIRNLKLPPSLDGRLDELVDKVDELVDAINEMRSRR